MNIYIDIYMWSTNRNVSPLHFSQLVYDINNEKYPNHAKSIIRQISISSRYIDNPTPTLAQQTKYADP